MANHTLLDAVNETLKRVGILDSSNTGLLSTLTQSAQQGNIDVAIQVINEGIDDLYSAAEVELPSEGAEATFTLVNGQREYSLPSNLVKLFWPLSNRANLQYIYQWQGSYVDFLLIDPQQLYTGLPTWAMISPITSMLRVDRQPDSTTAGAVYTFEYEKDVSLALATDQVPFNNEVFRGMVPAWAELWRRGRRREFDQALYISSMGRAARMLTQVPQKTSYSPRVI